MFIIQQLLPCFTKFILKFSTEEVPRLQEIIANLRSCLKWPDDLPTTKANIHKNQREVISAVSRTLIRSKQLFDVWLKYIQSNVDKHLPIDLIVLIMMMTINDEKSIAIENIVRIANSARLWSLMNKNVTNNSKIADSSQAQSRHYWCKIARGNRSSSACYSVRILKSPFRTIRLFCSRQESHHFQFR